MIEKVKSYINGTKFQESVDTLKIKFEGGNNIDAEIFTSVINNTIELIKASANAIAPDATLRIELKNIDKENKEAFTTVIDVIARVRKDSSSKNNITLASEIVSGFLSFLQIKSHLNGRNPKSIDQAETGINQYFPQKEMLEKVKND